MQSTASLKPIKKPFIRKVYKGHGMMIGIPKKVVHDLDLEPEDYVHLYYDEYNDQLIVRKVPDLDDRGNNNV
jgi:hypothetical protein